METTVLLLTAVLLLSAAGDQTRPDQTISVQSGQDVTLTGPDCSGMTSCRVQKRGSVKYVDYCRDGHPIRPKNQDSSFEGRVGGMKCPMQDGNVSTTLKKVTTGDTGKYDWLCKNSTGNSSSTVYLKVTDGGAADGNATSRNATSGNSTSGNATSGNAPDLGNILGGIFGALAFFGIIGLILSWYHTGFSCRNPCRPSDEQDLELPVAYREVNQQQV